MPSLIVVSKSDQLSQGMLSFGGYELTVKSSCCSCKIFKGNVAPKAIRCWSDRVMVMLRDWNDLSDTMVKVGHSVAEVICKGAPCQMRFERSARAHLADAGCEKCDVLLSRVDFQRY